MNTLTLKNEIRDYLEEVPKSFSKIKPSRSQPLSIHIPFPLVPIYFDPEQRISNVERLKRIKTTKNMTNTYFLAV